MMHLGKSWQETEDESKEIVKRQSVLMRSLGLGPVAKISRCSISGIPEGMEEIPYLMNRSEDPSLVGCCKYFLQPGMPQTVGNDESWSQIVLNGVGILPRMCTILNMPDSG